MYRSPLAAARFRQMLQEQRRPDSWIVESAGTWTVPGRPLPPEVLRAAGACAIHMKSHVTRQVDCDLLAGYDLILVMEKGHREALGIEFPQVAGRLCLLSELVDGLPYDIPDPLKSGQELDELAAEMFRLIDRGVQKICQTASLLHNNQP
jgi:protein-tyrosine phosphatase